MNDVDTLVFVMMLDEGIIPFSWPPQKPFRESLSMLSQPEATAAKRKFRKLWRKAIKLEVQGSTHLINMKRSCGMGLREKDIRSQHRIYRARLVYKMFFKKVSQDQST